MTLCQMTLTAAGFLLVVLASMLVDLTLARDKAAAILEIKGDFNEESPAKMFPPRGDLPASPEPNFLLWNSRKLKKIAGEYDARYESVKKPRHNGTRGGETTTAASRKELLASMPSELKDLQFTLFGSERELGVRASKKLRLWLWSVSSCPVLARWKDSGATIWPRYINIGECSQKNSCSYPKGMKCMPSKFKRIPRLWWACHRFGVKGSPCTWVKFYTKVVEKCTCGCQPSERNPEGKPNSLLGIMRRTSES